MSQQAEEAEANIAAEEEDETTDVGTEEEDETTDGGAGGDETTNGDTRDGDRTDGGSANMPTKKKKKDIKDPTSQVLVNISEEFIEVIDSGLPVAHVELAGGYDRQLGCIVRESMSINTKHLRGAANELLVGNLLQKLHR
jgi:hypothetical protein